MVSGNCSQTLSYDQNGNLTSDGSKTYEWEAANRLTAINYTGTNKRSELASNGLSQRVKIVEQDNEAVCVVPERRAAVRRARRGATTSRSDFMRRESRSEAPATTARRITLAQFGR